MHVPCEFCGSSDAGWRFEDGGFHCYKCHESRPPPTSAESQDEQEPPKVEKKSRAKLLEVTPISLTKRGIRQDTCEKWGYGAAEFKGEQVQVAQYFDEKGVVCGQKLRTANKEFLILGDIKPAGLYGKHLWKDGGRLVVVTEGEIDALSMSQVQGNKWPVVSLPNGAPGGKNAVKDSLEWLEKFDKVVFMLDMDEEGNKAARACCEVLTPGKGHIAVLPLKDANEMLKAGRVEELIQAMWQAKSYRPDGVLDGDEIWERAMAEDLADSSRWIHSGLQEKTRGMRLGEVTTFVAGTGAGKSTFLREQVLDLMLEQNEKVGVLALEESVRRTFLGYMSILQSKPLHFYKNAEIDKERLAADWLRVKHKLSVYDHHGVRDPDQIFSKIRYMAKALGCKFIVLDHVSIVVSGLDLDDDERRTLDLIYTKLTSLASELNCHITVICHLRRPQGQAHEEGRHISLSDLRGTGGIAQMSFDVIALERNQQAESGAHTATLRVLKCRHTGDLGVAGEMIYDPETSRFKERKTEFDPATPEELGAVKDEVPVREPEKPQGEVVQGVQRKKRKGKVEPAVAEHGPRPVGETSAKG